MTTNRMQKMDNLILRSLSTELNERFPDKIFSLTMVHVSKDLSFAKIWVSSVDDADKLVKSFSRMAGELRTKLAKTIVARKVPSLYFVVDNTEEKAIRIDSLLAQIETKEEKK